MVSALPFLGHPTYGGYKHVMTNYVVPILPDTITTLGNFMKNLSMVGFYTLL